MNQPFTGYLIAVLGIPALMGFWILVQRAWHSVFEGEVQDEDALACRGTCAGCTGKCSGKGKGEAL